MNINTRKEMIKAIELVRESTKNNMDIALCSYSEVMSKLDLIVYILLNENKNIVEE